MKTRTKYVAALLVMLLLVTLLPQTVFCTSEMTSIVNLQTEDKTDPIGIDTKAPLFSWQMESNVIGADQTAYQIVVKDNADESEYGTIYSSWTASNGAISTYQCTVPANTTATLYLPVESVGDYTDIFGVSFDGVAVHNGINTAKFKLLSGSYEFDIAEGNVSVKIADGYISKVADLEQEMSPQEEDTTQLWWLLLILPVLAVIVLFILRKRNKAKA